MERGAAHTPARAQGREQSIRGGEEVSKVPERGPQGKTGAALAHPSTRRERGRASDSGGPRAPRAQAWHRVRPLRSYQRSRGTPALPHEARRARRGPAPGARVGLRAGPGPSQSRFQTCPDPWHHQTPGLPAASSAQGPGTLVASVEGPQGGSWFSGTLQSKVKL